IRRVGGLDKGKSTSQPHRHLHLRSLLLLLAAGAALPVVVFAGIVVWQLVAEQRAATERRLIETARTQAAAVEREMAATIRTLQALAHSERFEQGDLAAFHGEATRVQRSQPDWYNVILFAPDGQERISVLRPTGPLRRVTDTDSFQRVIATRQPIVGNLLRGPIDGPLGVPIRVPVIRDDTLHGVLTAIITPERFANALFRDLPSSDGWTRTISDTHGTVAASSKFQQSVGQPAPPSLLEHTRRLTEGVYREAMVDG